MKKTLLNVALLAALSSSAAVATANEAGDIIVRAGLTNVALSDDKPTIYAADMTVHLAEGGPALKASVEDDTQLGLNLAYFVTDRVAIELLAATPFSHDLNVHVGDTTLNLGSTKHLPPVLSALYYFNEPTSKIQPYAGIGINYTVFFDDNFNSTMSGDAVQVGALNDTSIADLAPALGLPAGTESVGLQAKDLNLKNSWGLAAQFGVDYHLEDNFIINASVRYIDIDTTATFKATALEVPGKVSVNLNPLVYTLSVGYKF
ncbi:OmpW family protein [Psychrobium sp. 1_MG-2023]|uniref:OmpW/AlkL family protein n=1 Tax=Psychrobium sp. 1_MG-2023 TaxID=3062624 RepID=UPI000C3467DC|nr:OmpW family outer membrane protein [Psychrobium sp. 1_MG-2023]MDP2562869.1 OmpW family outer membrane protein [Psychrobium sp. 1_MG-2023]PKF57154.1 outer membrane protein OmpW [Alteromonadales bacterium alter-6D02]